MSVYRNTAGNWTVDVSEPWPMWVTLRYGPEDILHGVRAHELYDLKHLIDRAIIAAEARDPDVMACK